MVTIADISAATAILNRASDGIEKIRDIAKKTIDMETQELIVDMRSQLVTVQSVLINAQAEINNLKEENASLQKKLKQRDEVEYIGGAYYSKKDTGKKQPFCSSCFESNGDLITLRPSTQSDSLLTRGPEHMKCNICKGHAQLKIK